VRAVDPLGASRICSKIFTFTTLERSKAVSQDGVLSAKALSTLPEGAYLFVEKAEAATALAAAEANLSAMRHIRAFTNGIYRVQVVDKNGSALDGLTPDVRITMIYADSDGDSYIDGSFVPIESARIARLDEQNSRWEIPPGTQSSNTLTKRVTADVKGLSYFALAGSLPPDKLLTIVNVFPNPFNPVSGDLRVIYVLNTDARVEATVYSLIGERVKSWEFDESGNPNGVTHEFRWNGANGAGRTVANGMYILVIKASGGGRESSERRYVGVLK
jgi:hypothetical protein